VFGRNGSDDAPLLLRVCGVPLMLYNMARYRAQDHKMYLISKQEYKHFSRMERQYQVKTVYYTIQFTQPNLKNIAQQPF
jgi:hypothetical protein